jgi:hypothetical protein
MEHDMLAQPARTAYLLRNPIYSSDEGGDSIKCKGGLMSPMKVVIQ